MISKEVISDKLENITQGEIRFLSESVSKTLLTGDVKKYRLFNFVSETFHSEDVYSLREAKELQRGSDSLSILENK